MSNKSLILLQQENLELTKENNALKITVTKLLEKIDEILHIDRTPNPNRIVLSTEQNIIEEQIDSFSAISKSRGLTLEEIRALDLLIKNKKLLDDTKSIEPDYSKVPDGSTESDLLRIAGNVEEPITKKRSKSKAGHKDPVA